MIGRVFRNTDDTRRAHVFQIEDQSAHKGRWDFDLYKRHMLNGGWSVEESWCGQSTCKTEADAVRWLEDLGLFVELHDLENMTQGWPDEPPPKPTKDAAIEIKPYQTWRQGTRTLRVTWIQPHWQDRKRREVGYVWTSPSGRERGHMIIGRRHEQSTNEENFRAKFRYVPDCNDTDTPPVSKRSHRNASKPRRRK